MAKPASTKKGQKPAEMSVDVAAFLVDNATAGVTAKKKSGPPELGGHEGLADRAVTAYQAMKDAEAAFKLVEVEVLEVTGPEYEARSRAGEHSKSFDLVGDKTKGIQVVYQDKFSDLAIEQEPGLREQLGDKFDRFFEQRRKLTLKDDATDDATIKMLLSKLGPEDFKRLFDIKVTLATKDDMDRKQFEIPEGVRTLCGLKQAKPGVKPVKKG